MSKKPAYDPEKEEIWYLHVRTFEDIMQIGTLQEEGLIRRLQYRWERDGGEYVVRFEGPSTYFDLPKWFALNYDGDYYPDAHEEKRKWHDVLTHVPFEVRRKWGVDRKPKFVVADSQAILDEFCKVAG